MSFIELYRDNDTSGGMSFLIISKSLGNFSISQKGLRLFYTSKSSMWQAESLCFQPHLSIIDNDIGAFFVYLCRHPSVDHLGMCVPQRRLFVRGRFIGSLGYFCIPYPTTVLAVASHRTHGFIHRRQSHTCCGAGAGVKPSSSRVWHTCCASYQFPPVCGQPGLSGAQMRFTPFPCTNRA
jgi:hypothetical protein